MRDASHSVILPPPQSAEAPSPAKPAAGPRSPSWIRGAAATVVSLAVTVGLWELVVVVFGVGAYTLPTPVSVATELAGGIGYLAPALGVTLEETMIGFLVAVLAGVLLAGLIAASRLVERLVYPLLIVTNAVPKIALAPVFLAWFGLGDVPRIVMAALLAIFPIVISTVVGLVGVDEGLLLVGRAANAGRLRTFRIIRFPAALPAIFGGLKVGISLALTGAVVGELVGGNTGLGYIITSAQGNLQLPLAFAAIVLLAAAGIVLFYLIELLEKLVTHS